jgi:hypothetical protein
MELAPESEGLLSFERAIAQDPQTLLHFISSWEGSDWFWQLIVFVTYAEQSDLRKRMENALSALAMSGSSQSNAALAEQLLNKVQLVNELTHEEILYQQVQRLALILIPTQQAGTV